MNTSDEIYSMKLHDILNTNKNGVLLQIIRVPGGWLYTQFLLQMIPNHAHLNNSFTENYSATTVFVPFNNVNEFQIREFTGPPPPPVVQIKKPSLE